MAVGVGSFHRIGGQQVEGAAYDGERAQPQAPRGQALITVQPVESERREVPKVLQAPPGSTGWLRRHTHSGHGGYHGPTDPFLAKLG